MLTAIQNRTTSFLTLRLDKPASDYVNSHLGSVIIRGCEKCLPKVS
jgi:hypothetical protein